MGKKRKSRSRLLPNVHPGDILHEDFLKPMKLSQAALAKATAISPSSISRIVRGKRSVTSDISIRLDQYFGLSDGFFLRVQNDYDEFERRRWKKIDDYVLGPKDYEEIPELTEEWFARAVWHVGGVPVKRGSRKFREAVRRAKQKGA